MVSAIGQFPKIDGYKLVEQLYSSAQTRVYRAIQLTQQQSVIIKVLAKAYPSQYELARFRSQYAITKSLSISGVASVLGLEPYEGGEALVIEDDGSISLDRYAPPLSLTDVLEVGLQLADILHDIHQLRVIHKDIKPANVLIHPQSKRVKLIDFSAASMLPKEMQALQSPQALAGTLAYLSPEQTGRMNRGIDYRTDYYSLGVTLYQLLTDKLPFSGDDPLELMHCHLARIPVPISQLKPDVPSSVGAIVAKLMAKNAEDRYQSALGLKHDLMRCLEQWKQKNTVTVFELGQKDISDRFLIPEKLYGREAEVTALLMAFERAAEGDAELTLVSGFSGIGKTAVVNEIHKPVVRRRGYFIKGKFDQFNRSTPLSAFVQAMQALIAQLLSESDERLSCWRSQILDAIGESGQVLVEVLPDLVEIIGYQPPIVELSGVAEQTRFSVLFQKFVGIFARADHPLVIFLDDLQWADEASLTLIKRLLKGQKHLFLIGAYRNNEVSSSHPLTLAVEALQQQQISTQTVTLSALSLDCVNRMISETLGCSPDSSESLARLVYCKTKGNPFFITQFLGSLYSEGELSFDVEKGQWIYDISRIAALTLADDVVEFMAQQLQKLPKDTQDVLKLAACVGNQFELDMLATVAEKSPADIAQVLWPALEEGLVLAMDRSYKVQDRLLTDEIEDIVGQQHANSSYQFLHDRIQQAAAFLLDAEDKQQTHLKIGRLLLENTSQEERERFIFDIAGHLNIGMQGRENVPLAECSMSLLAELNLAAGRKAKRANAIATAADYFKLGLQWLPDDSWESHYLLAFDLYREGGECAYLNGDFETSQHLLNVALSQASSGLDKAKVYAIVMNLVMTQGDDFKLGIKAGLEGLALLGLDIPTDAIALKEQVARDAARLQQQIEKTDIAQLYHHRTQDDPAQNLIMHLLVDLWALAYLDGDSDLLNVSVVQMVLTSLNEGNTSLSAFGYVTYAMNIAFEQQYQTAYQLARLAQQLNEKFNRTDLVGKVNNLFCNAINPYNRPLSSNLAFYQASYRSCMECGDLTYGVWALFLGIWTRFDSGEPLSIVKQEADRYLDSVEQIGDVNMHLAYLSLRRVVEHLSGEPSAKENPTAQDWAEADRQGWGRYSLDDETFKEADCLARWQENSFDHGLNWYHYLKAQMLYTYDQYGAALQTFQAVEDKVAANVGFFPATKYYFYYLLVLTALYPNASDAERADYWPIIKRHYAQLQVWADSCPENFLHQALIAQAEMARVCDRACEQSVEQPASICDLYESAIESARESEFVQHEALANELAAKFYLSRGKEKCAVGYLQAAYACYARWGAVAKTRDLERRYAGVLLSAVSYGEDASLGQTYPTLPTTVNPSMYPSAAYPSTAASSGGLISPLDLTAILRASQSLSSEIDLDRLLATVLYTALEMSGADRGVLVMPQDSQWYVEAVATIDSAPRVNRVALSDYTEISQGALRTVQRSLKPIVVDRAMTHSALANDLYVSQRAVKSLLCAPILRGGQLVGLLYLENRVTVGAFTCDRVETLQMLAAQAAISISNARLYRQIEQHSQTLEAEVERQTQALRQKAVDLEQTLTDLRKTQAKLIQSEKMSALGQLVGGVAHEINNPVNFIHGNLKHASNYVSDLLNLISVYQHEYPQDNSAIREAMEDINLDFLAQDSLRLFESMRTGTRRISQIVLDLRNFSRLDEAELKPVDLHDGLENALRLLKHRLHKACPSVRIKRDYDDLPLVTCYASQLNQVFYGLLSNALDAVQDEQVEMLPVVSISTQRLENGAVGVCVGDNGRGVAADIRKRMFEPFFTTKSVGDGTGLGLAVSYAIVKQHGGTIRCESQENEGTQMIIELPIEPSV